MSIPSQSGKFAKNTVANNYGTGLLKGRNPLSLAVFLPFYLKVEKFLFLPKLS